MGKKQQRRRQFKFTTEEDAVASVDLVEPIKIAGITLEALHFRAPTVADIGEWGAGSEPTHAQLCKLAAVLAGVPASVVLRFGFADYGPVAKVMNGFFAQLGMETDDSDDTDGFDPSPETSSPS